MRRLWILDGYNLILRLGGVHEVDAAELRRRRESLERLAADFAQRRGQDMRIVYDGRSLGGSHPGARRQGRLAVTFAEPPAEADDVIYKLAEQECADGRPVRVATSDRELAVRSRQAGAETLTVEEFAALLTRCRPAPAGDEPALPADVAEHFLEAHDTETALAQRAADRNRRLAEWQRSRAGTAAPAAASSGGGVEPQSAAGPADGSGDAGARQRGQRRQQRRLQQQRTGGGKGRRRGGRR